MESMVDVDLTDEQLLAELESLPADLDHQLGGSQGDAGAQQGEDVPAISEGPPAQAAEEQPPSPASPAGGCAGSSSVPVLQEPSAKASGTAAASAQPSSHPAVVEHPSMVAPKKRGLVAMAKKAAKDTDMAVSPAAKPPAPPKQAAAFPKKVIVGRVVHEGDSSGDAAPGDERDRSPAATADALTAMDPAKAEAAAGGGAKKKGLSVQKPAASKAAAAAAEANKKVAAAAIAKTPAAQGKGKKAAKPAADGGAPKVKRAKSAYIFFCSDRRASVKAEEPALSQADLMKKLAELWKALPVEDKAPFEAGAPALAQQDKERTGRERGEAAAQPGKGAKAAAADAGSPAAPKQLRAKTAYQLFCNARREAVKAANPDAGFKEMSSLLAAAWKDAREAERAPFVLLHQARCAEQKEQLQAANPAAAVAPKRARKAPRPAAATAAPSKAASEDSASDDAAGDEDDADESAHEEDCTAAADPVAAKIDLGCPPAPKKAKAPAKKKRARGAAAASASVPAQPDEDGEDSIEQDLMDVDWEAHPAEHIIAETLHHKYLVRRKGLDFSACGLVDARAAKRQRSAIPTPQEPDQAPPPPACRVSLAMMDEYDAFARSFQCSVHAHSDGGELDLDDLNQESPLEMCSLLGVLREPHFPLSRVADKNKDVPMLGLSRAVQRVVCLERSAAAEARAQAATLRAQLAALGQPARQGPAGDAAAAAKVGIVAGAEAEE